MNPPPRAIVCPPAMPGSGSRQCAIKHATPRAALSRLAPPPAERTRISARSGRAIGGRPDCNACVPAANGGGGLGGGRASTRAVGTCARRPRPQPRRASTPAAAPSAVSCCVGHDARAGLAPGRLAAVPTPPTAGGRRAGARALAPPPGAGLPALPALAHSCPALRRDYARPRGAARRARLPVARPRSHWTARPWPSHGRILAPRGRPGGGAIGGDAWTLTHPRVPPAG
jgi:hypothetical protein